VFHLATSPHKALLRDLVERDLDLLIAWDTGDQTADERLAFEFLYDDKCVVVAGSQNPLARRRQLTLAELAKESWALHPPNSVLGQIATSAFRASGLEIPRAVVVTIADEARASLLATGRFLSIFPASGLKLSAERPQLKVLPVELPLTRLPTGIVTLKNRMLSPVAQLFIENAREVAKPLAKSRR
jgi:DNA-binding transcriptional LysR family regulator